MPSHRSDQIFETQAAYKNLVDMTALVEIASETPTNIGQEPGQHVTNKPTSNDELESVKAAPVPMIYGQPASQRNLDENSSPEIDSPVTPKIADNGKAIILASSDCIDDGLDDEISSASKNSSNPLASISTEEPTVNTNEDANKSISTTSPDPANDGFDEESSSTSTSDSWTTQDSDPEDETPFPYNIGQVLELRTSGGKRLSATIMKLYSITMSPVLGVRLQNWDGPQEVVLKLYDRRFGNYRKTSSYNEDPPIPHTTQGEEAFKRYIREGLIETLIKELEAQDDEEGSFEFADDDEPDDRPEWEKLAESEGEHYYNLRKDYTTEVRAYKELQELQGHCIPKLFSTVYFDMPSAQSDLPAIYFRVPGILIQKLDGCRLLDIFTELEKEGPSLWRKIIQDTVDIAAKPLSLGVMNDDASARNVVVAFSSEKEFQPYLVDFARAYFKWDMRFRECVFNNPDWKQGLCCCWSCLIEGWADPQQIGWDMACEMKRVHGQMPEIEYPKRPPHPALYYPRDA
ncbi:hypothetical protein ONZ43_g6778 [Nemania bipapillata]|uniref:Uncharacterized protein n=1 Tax=Nemania bipapillata TaxID=110536 RepID=A0ACC2HX68_9PEZI|nr:hypothetical protein ONZ43_g6778 [Nemania bipapillata]